VVEIIDIHRLVLELDKWKSISEVSKHLGYNTSKLSRVLNRLIEKGEISKYFVVPLEALSPKPSILLISKTQKTNLPCFKKSLKTITSYYSFTSVPFYIIYFLGDCSLVEENVVFPLCKYSVCMSIRETLIPLVNPETYTIELTSALSDKIEKLDENDVILLVELFRLFNPPSRSIRRNSEVIKYLESKIGVKNLRSRFYNKLYKYLTLRYAYRKDSDYLLIHITTPSTRELVEVLNMFLQMEIATSYLHVDVLSDIPLEVIVHAWGFYDKVIDENTSHQYVKNASYAIYPVIGVSYD